VNKAVLKAFSPSTQRVLLALAGSPDDASAFYDRLTIVRAGLRIGLEVLEKNLEESRGQNNPAHSNALATAAASTLGSCTALECCMATLEALHPSLAKVNTSADAPKGLPGTNGVEKIRRLDLD
jgi:hypothetical protein